MQRFVCAGFWVGWLSRCCELNLADLRPVNECCVVWLNCMQRMHASIRLSVAQSISALTLCISLLHSNRNLTKLMTKLMLWPASVFGGIVSNEDATHDPSLHHSTRSARREMNCPIHAIMMCMTVCTNAWQRDSAGNSTSRVSPSSSCVGLWIGVEYHGICDLSLCTRF